jgi:membrane protein DedA with SNARE-associated domain
VVWFRIHAIYLALKGWKQTDGIGTSLMSGFVDQVRQLIEAIIQALGYPGIALIMLVENVLPPIPSEIVMPMAGFLVSRDELTFMGALLAGTSGSLAGTVILYWLGRAAGEERALDWVRKYGKFLLIYERDFFRARDAFCRRGWLYLLLGRLVPGIRSLISVPAGLEQMKFAIYLFYTLLGTLAWNAILLLTGVFLGRRWDRVLEWIESYERILWILLAVLLVVFVMKRLGRKKLAQIFSRR